MIGALVILAALVVIGALLYVTDVKYFRHHHAGSKSPVKGQSVPTENLDTEIESEPEVCCGMHLVCEKTSLSIVSDEVVYYDDEELDRFVGRTPESYTSEETEEFRDILMTLLPQDVAGWARSVTLRKIELPSEVKDELLLLISDLRTSQ